MLLLQKAAAASLRDTTAAETIFWLFSFEFQQQMKSKISFLFSHSITNRQEILWIQIN